jgi:hypothetical protein
MAKTEPHVYSRHWQRGLSTLEVDHARGPHRPPRDTCPGASRNCVRLLDRSGQDPALDGDGGAVSHAQVGSISSTSPELVLPAAPSGRWCRFTAWPTASAGTAARWCRRGLVWSRSTCWTSNQTGHCYASPTPAFPMPSNAPAMQKAGPITLTVWPRLQPDATQAQTLGMAALAMSDPSGLLDRPAGCREVARNATTFRSPVACNKTAVARNFFGRDRLGPRRLLRRDVHHQPLAALEPDLAFIAFQEDPISSQAPDRGCYPRRRLPLGRL